MSVSIEREEIFKKLSPSYRCPVERTFTPASKLWINKTDVTRQPIEIWEKVGRFDPTVLCLTTEMLEAIRKAMGWKK